jgi:hypothetical protein
MPFFQFPFNACGFEACHTSQAIQPSRILQFPQFLERILHDKVMFFNPSSTAEKDSLAMTVTVFLALQWKTAV